MKMTLRPSGFGLSKGTLTAGLMVASISLLLAGCAKQSEEAKYASELASYNRDPAWIAVGLGIVAVGVLMAVVRKGREDAGCLWWSVAGLGAVVLSVGLYSRIGGPPAKPTWMVEKDKLELDREKLRQEKRAIEIERERQYEEKLRLERDKENAERESKGRLAAVNELLQAASNLISKAAKADDTAARFESDLSSYREKLTNRLKEMASEKPEVLFDDLKGKTWLLACKDLLARIMALRNHSRELKDSAFLVEEQAMTLKRKLDTEDAGLTREELATLDLTLREAKTELDRKIEESSLPSDIANADLLTWVSTGRLPSQK